MQGIMDARYEREPLGTAAGVCDRPDQSGADFRVNRSLISRESDHRFHFKAISVFSENDRRFHAIPITESAP